MRAEAGDSLAVLLKKPLLRMIGQNGGRNPELTACGLGESIKPPGEISSESTPVRV